ncbi:MAG TPA: GMP synthase (glutamine-hydrolyzing), partial [Brevundimonas sp.]|nr:GMP synthase (glutamine-hydrolyzing) [Brevundimonas sp.]
LGICYGEMTMCEQLGGKVEGGHTREFGRAEITVQKASPLLDGLAGVGEDEPVWMSHGDKIVAIPEGFDVIATSPGSPYAVIGDEARRFYGIQF